MHLSEIRGNSKKVIIKASRFQAKRWLFSCCYALDAIRAQKRKLPSFLFALALLCPLSGCDENGSRTGHPWNNPHRKSEYQKNIAYGSFTEPPKTLDPARSYSVDESIIISQIYEPPLQYQYLKRPYTLEPLTATALPKEQYLDALGKPLPHNTPTNKIAYTRYDITIKPNIYYQPHPAFARNASGTWRYHALHPSVLAHKRQLSDFAQWDTRELVAADYVYGIKRLAHPGLNTPILGIMEQHIVGLTDLRKRLEKAYVRSNKNGLQPFLDLRAFPLEGVQTHGRYHYSILVKKQFPQMRYWLTMLFFAPIPWEADRFYAQPNMAKNNINFDWQPVGTGPYTLAENNPNHIMRLERNPNFHAEYYPSTGLAADDPPALGEDAGKLLPFIDTIIFRLEKESIPRWYKFLQGYYDISTIGSDSFDQAIHINAAGQAELTPALQKKALRLDTSTSATIFYVGINMLDKVVGGYSESARKLRQALSIAYNTEEFISIFQNGRGTPAQGPIPPSIFSYSDKENGINPIVYDRHHGRAHRKPLKTAQRLLAEAGYPNGIDPKTGKPLILYYDTTSMSNGDDKARFDWLHKQFAKLGIELQVRATQYNRFQQKVRTGAVQLFSWGWVADYPDPENFLMILYGPHGKVAYGGTNASNYANPAFDRLFEQMKNLSDTPKRRAIIERMLTIVRKDAPWIWGFYPRQFTLYHAWNRIGKTDDMIRNVSKYARLDPILRSQKQAEWNPPYSNILLGLILLLGSITVPAILQYRKKLHCSTLTRRCRDAAEIEACNIL